MRATPDPHYGLGVVVCPRCQQGVVRIKHPDRAFWNDVRRTIHSIRMLLLTLIFTALSVGALAGITMWIMPLITDRRGKLRLPIDASPSDQSVLIMSALLVLLCGVVIRAVYAHQRFWVASLILLLPSSVLLSIDWSIGSLLARLNRVSTTSMHIDVPDRLEMVRRYESFVVLACIATLGLLVGIVLNRYIARGASKRIVRRRRKLRARQARQD